MNINKSDIHHIRSCQPKILAKKTSIKPHNQKLNCSCTISLSALCSGWTSCAVAPVGTTTWQMGEIQLWSATQQPPELLPVHGPLYTSSPKNCRRRANNVAETLRGAIKNAPHCGFFKCNHKRDEWTKLLVNPLALSIHKTWAEESEGGG